jgi:hypothetical protein
MSYDDPNNCRMEFYGQDLEDLQRVAGLLHVSVDELVAQSRTLNISTGTRAQSYYVLEQNSSTEFLESTGFVQDDDSAYQEWTNVSLLPASDNYEASQYNSAGASSEMGMIDPQRRMDVSSGIDYAGGELLNPDSNPLFANYGCNMITDFSSFLTAINDGDFNGINDIEDQESHVPQVYAEDEISYVFIEQEGEEFDMEDGISSQNQPGDAVSAQGGISIQYSTSSSQRPIIKQGVYANIHGGQTRHLPAIAPKPEQLTDHKKHAMYHVDPANKVRKKRQPLNQERKLSTNLTRQIYACVRCRMQRNRVSI